MRTLQICAFWTLKRGTIIRRWCFLNCDTFAAFFAVLIMNGLPRPHHPIFNWDRFSRASNDGFFLVIEARDPRFTELEARELLERSGGEHITIVHED